jgi:thioesterase domain-containing protein/acyl carrier protein
MLKTLPLTPTGKVDRKALPPPEIQFPTDKFVPPTTPTEIALAKIWSEVLGVKQIGLHDNYFDLGGHSLQAVRLLAAVQNHFGIATQLSSLFVAPTLQQYAQLLAESVEKVATGLSGGLRGSGTGTPLFYIPGAAGYEFLPRGLEQHLAKTCRYYDGLEYPGRDGRQPIPNNVPDVAAHLVKQIRCVWPDGPYILTGWSFGGVMAFEVARQLEAQGAKVPLVMLLDSRLPGLVVRKRSTREIIEFFRHRLSTLSITERLAFLREVAVNKIKFLWITKVWFFRNQSRIDTQPRTESPPMVEAMRQAVRRYQPGPFGGNVVLFQVEKWETLYASIRYVLDSDFGWSKFVRGRLEIVPVPGDHRSLLNEPGVSKVSERITAYLRVNGAPLASKPLRSSLIKVSIPSDMRIS